MDPGFSLTDAEVHALGTQRLLVLRDDAAFRLEGPGTSDCLQGLLTNDVMAGGDRGLVWGALLTSKGMIITDAWVRREGPAAATVIVPAMARTRVGEHFQRILPPRLARVSDLTGQVTVGWFIGHAAESAQDSDVVLPHGPGPFSALLLSRDCPADVRRFEEMGWTVVAPSFGEASKLLLGWPTLGREIDERTMIQEVRFDELEGVRYDKGCYTGQETVARLHFRGHPNRLLRGISWPEGDSPNSSEVTSGGKFVGTLTTIAKLGSRTIALAVLRREVVVGDHVMAGGAEGTVTELPFAATTLRVA